MRDWPRRQSPAANTPSTLVLYFWDGKKIRDNERLTGSETDFVWRLNIQSGILFDPECFDDFDLRP
jgi:hypothetical protein